MTDDDADFRHIVIDEVAVGDGASGPMTMGIRQSGAGPDVLLIAGLGDDAATWENQLSSLAGFRVTAVDNRGIGRTAAPAGPITVADMAADTAELICALGLGPVHVVGNSMGAAIAQDLALRHPELVRSLVLSGGWCRADPMFRAVITSWAVGALDAAHRREFFGGVLAWAVAPSFYNSGTPVRWIEELLASATQSGDDFARQCHAVLDFDSYDRVPEIGVPTLVLFGEQDILVGGRHARVLSERIPHASQAVLPDSGHSPFAEDPVAFDRALRRFWSTG